MNSMIRFTTGIYKGKTYGEVYEILQTTDKSFLKKLKGKNIAFLDYFNKRESEKEVVDLPDDSGVESVVSTPHLEFNLHGQNVDYIYHLSDIHIRAFDRMEEYLSVFERLYEVLRKEPNGLIVICGDILHNKTVLAPETIILTNNFFHNLSEIHPVVFIAGNHDANLKNNDRVDSLSAIMKGINSSRIHYLRNSGIYHYGNITFGVTSLLQKDFMEKPRFVLANELPNNGNIKIALFHGQVDCFNFGFTLDKIYEKKYFDGYDYTLLGDAHTFAYGNSEKTMAYSSSLISQTFKEVDLDHGYLKWDLKNKTSSYQRIPNDYQRHAYEIHEGNIIIDKVHYSELDFKQYLTMVKLPLNGHFRIRYDDKTDGVEVKKFIELIENNCPTPHFKMEKVFASIKDHLGICKGTEFSMDQLETYCEGKHFDYQGIINELGQFEAFKLQYETNFSSWKLVKMTFENVLGFSGVSVLDFSKYPTGEVIGIFAPNQSGKTTTIDMISYGLFGKCSRFSSPPADFISFGKDSFRIEIEVMIGGDSYTIKKTGKKRKGKDEESLKVNSSFYKNNICLDAETSKKTEQFIISKLGTYEMFISSSVFIQQSYESFFMPKSQTQRKEYLYKILGLDVFHSIENAVKDKYSVIKSELNAINGKLSKVNLIDLKERCVHIKSEVELIDSSIELNNNKKESLQNMLNESTSKMHVAPKYSQLLIDLQKLQVKVEEETLALQKKIFSKSSKNEKLGEFVLIPLEDEIRTQHNTINGRIIELSKTLFQDAIQTMEEKCEIEDKLDNVCKELDTIICSDDFDDSIIEREIEEIKNKIKMLKSKIKFYTIKEKPDILEIDKINVFLKENHDISEKYIFFKNTCELRDKLQLELKTCMEWKEKLSLYEFNPDCSYCTANAFVIDAKLFINKIPQIEKEITKLTIDDTIPNTYQKYGELEKRKEFLEEQLFFVEENNKGEKLNNEIVELEDIIQSKRNIIKVFNKKCTLSHKKRNLRSKLHFLENMEITKKIEEEKKKDRMDLLIEQKRIAEQLILEINKLEIEISKKTSEIEMLRSDKIKNENMLILSEENEKIHQEYCQCTKQLAKIQDDIFDMKVKRNSLAVEEETIQTKIKEIEQDNLNVKALEGKEKLYSQLKTVVTKNGYSLFLLEKYLPRIEETVNTVIGQYINKEIKLYLDGDTLVFKGYENKNVTTVFAGSESFILELAFKLVFSTISKKPQSNFLFIDEHVSVLDVEKIDNFDHILEFLKQNYHQTFIVSHIPNLKEKLNHLITIENGKLIT